MLVAERSMWSQVVVCRDKTTNDGEFDILFDVCKWALRVINSHNLWIRNCRNVSAFFVKRRKHCD
jgi:hypothetical protein